MIENSEIQEVGRRIDSLEKGLQRDRERVDEDRRRTEEEKRQRSERRSRMTGVALWTLYVIAMTTYVVLAVTGNLHHH